MINTRQQQINDQRAMLDWLEQHPDVKVFFADAQCILFPHEKEEFASITKQLGTFEKETEGSDLKLVKRFGTANFNVTIPLAAVGEKTVAMKEIETWNIPDLSIDSEPTPEFKRRIDAMAVIGFAFDGNAFTSGGMSFAIADIEPLSDETFDTLAKRLTLVIKKTLTEKTTV